MEFIYWLMISLIKLVWEYVNLNRLHKLQVTPPTQPFSPPSTKKNYQMYTVYE